MPSIHTIRWIENLKETSFELFWFDILGRGKLDTNIQIKQIVNWKKRKLPYVKGEYFLSKRTPNLYNNIKGLFEITENEYLEKIINEIKPDIIHSFEMQSCSYPIVKTMIKYPAIKWIYSCWGSDLFFYENFNDHKKKIVKVLSRVDCIFTDCERDFTIAKKLGFKKKHLGIIPGGTGYDLNFFKTYVTPLENRKIILVKGYQHKFGRALKVIKALEKLDLKEYDVRIFGAHNQVIEYIKLKKLKWIVYHRNELSHESLIKLMGESLLYIGNSISDGLPNTLLEAILMGAFPIQSNPGNVTTEIINDGKNGFLIPDPENSNEISVLIIKAINNIELIRNAFLLNQKIAIERLDYLKNKDKVIAAYNSLIG
jgi:glycosyltransferase involved in cell wall biosynthesis